MAKKMMSPPLAADDISSLRSEMMQIAAQSNLFCNMAINAGRYEVKNANDPTPGNITEEKESSLKRFASYAELILGVFGYKVFRPLAEYKKKGPATKNTNKHTATSSTNFADIKAEILLSGGKPSATYMKHYAYG